MNELVLLKLGGSLITDKRRREAPRMDVIARLAREVASARRQRPELRLVIGHGSGSFGHPVAAHYGVREGYLDDWFGYAATAAAAQRLDRLVTDAFLGEGVPAVSLQPSASAWCRDGHLEYLESGPLSALLDRGVVPLVYGDVALDHVRGCTIISTEEILAYLAGELRPQRLVIAGYVGGVYTADPQVDPSATLIAQISADSFPEVERMLFGAAGADVTGGMASKVRTMMDLVREQPGLIIRVVSGLQEGVLERVLLDPLNEEGTLIRA